MSSSRESRQKQFKNAGKHEEMRRRRAEGSLELRKQKKDENLMKRRNVESETGDDQEDIPGANQQLEVKTASGKQITLDECIKILSSNPNRDQVLYTIEAVRRMLSRSRDPPIGKVIEAGLVPYLVQSLKLEDPAINFEAAWALTNIVSGTSEETAIVVSAGALDPLVHLLRCKDLKVADQAAWALGNIAGESAQYRDKVLAGGLLNGLNHLMKQKLTVDLARTLAWIFSNVSRHKDPHPSMEVISEILPHVVLLLHHNDKNVMTDSCWALSYVTDGSDQQIQAALDNGILRRVVQFLETGEAQFVAPALRTLGNVVTGTDPQTQAVVDTGLLTEVIPNLLTLGSPQALKECCWMLSNVVAGTKGQIQAVIDAGLLPLIVSCLEKDAKTQFEATWILANMCQGGTPEQVMELVRNGATEPVCRLLENKNPKMVINMLDALEMILQVADKCDKLEDLSLIIEECGGLDKIEMLQQHESEQIYIKAVTLIETYFGSEMEDKENCEPQDIQALEVPTDGFNFS